MDLEHQGRERRVQRASLVVDVDAWLRGRGEIDHGVAQTRRDDRYLSMLFIDVDGFKAINDEFWHLAGDAAIIEAGHLFSEVFRTADVIGRYGGDEFCVLAMTNTPESTGLLESRLESALADHAARGTPGLSFRSRSARNTSASPR